MSHTNFRLYDLLGEGIREKRHGLVSRVLYSKKKPSDEGFFFRSPAKRSAAGKGAKTLA